MRTAEYHDGLSQTQCRASRRSPLKFGLPPEGKKPLNSCACAMSGEAALTCITGNPKIASDTVSNTHTVF